MALSPEARKAAAAYQREYRTKNREKMKQKQREYYAANKEKFQEYRETYWNRKIEAEQQGGKEA